MENDAFIIVNATNEYCNLLSVSRKEIIGRQVPEVFPDDLEGWKAVKHSFKKAVHAHEPDHMDILRYDVVDPKTGKKNEKYWQVQNVPLKDPNRHGRIYIWNSIVDKTTEIILGRKAREVEHEINRAKSQNHVFIQQNVDGLYSLDPSGKFLTVNEGLVQIAETSREELLSMDFIPFCAAHDMEKILNCFNQALKGIPQKFEADFVSGKGREMVLSIDLLPMKIEEEIRGVYGIAKDVTSLRISEQNLSQKRKFLELYSQIIDFLVSYGVETANLEYIFSQIGSTVGADRIYYLGQSLEDLDRETIIANNFQWRKKAANTISWKPNLWWFQRLVERFGPFNFDTPILLGERGGEGSEENELFAHLEGGSLLVLPLFVKEKFLGVVGVENNGTPKIWQQEEIEFMQSLLKNVISFVENRMSDLEVEKKERELERTQEKFELLVQEGSDLIGILEADGTYKFVSASSSRVLNIDPEQFIGRNAFDFIHPDDKNFVFAQFSSIALQRQIHIPPFRFIDAEGNWRWVETIATNLLKTPGIEGIVTNSRDVTQEVKRTNEIKELNERYRLAATATRDLIYDWNLETDEVTRYLEGKEKMFGYSLETMRERTFWKTHIHPDDLERLTKHLDDTLTNPNAVEIKTQYRFRKSDGTYAHIIDRGRIIRDEEGKALKLIGATSDISEINSSKNALKLANIRFNYAMKATREMMWDWNIEEDTILRSNAFKKIYGYNEAEKPSVKNFWLNKILEKDRGKVEESLFAALADPKISKWKKEYRFIKESGERSYVVDRGYIIRDASGKAVRMVGATLDVTESRRMLKKFKKQNKILREIAWEQAHVVRGPLTRLKGLTHLLREEIHDEWNQQELIDLIDKSADELDEIIIKIIRRTEELDKSE
ncbi:PAS domain-containing protein [Salinimicrobium catena]|uniref:PAS domain-containing protein n=1 Tax=Salinimicrobium catena TaxID=390640 RepID=UPI002FE4923B